MGKITWKDLHPSHIRARMLRSLPSWFNTEVDSTLSRLTNATANLIEVAGEYIRETSSDLSPTTFYLETPTNVYRIATQGVLAQNGRMEAQMEVSGEYVTLQPVSTTEEFYYSPPSSLVPAGTPTSFGTLRNEMTSVSWLPHVLLPESGLYDRPVFLCLQNAHAVDTDAVLIYDAETSELVYQSDALRTTQQYEVQGNDEWVTVDLTTGQAQLRHQPIVGTLHIYDPYEVDDANEAIVIPESCYQISGDYVMLDTVSMAQQSVPVRTDYIAEYDYVVAGTLLSSHAPFQRNHLGDVSTTKPTWSVVQHMDNLPNRSATYTPDVRESLSDTTPHTITDITQLTEIPVWRVDQTRKHLLLNPLHARPGVQVQVALRYLAQVREEWADPTNPWTITTPEYHADWITDGIRVLSGQEDITDFCTVVVGETVTITAQDHDGPLTVTAAYEAQRVITVPTFAYLPEEETLTIQTETVDGQTVYRAPFSADQYLPDTCQVTKTDAGGTTLLVDASLSGDYVYLTQAPDPNASYQIAYDYLDPAEPLYDEQYPPTRIDVSSALAQSIGPIRSEQCLVQAKQRFIARARTDETLEIQGTTDMPAYILDQHQQTLSVLGLVTRQYERYLLDTGEVTDIIPDTRMATPRADYRDLAVYDDYLIMLRVPNTPEPESGVYTMDYTATQAEFVYWDRYTRQTDFVLPVTLPEGGSPTAFTIGPDETIHLAYQTPRDAAVVHLYAFASTGSMTEPYTTLQPEDTLRLHNQMDGPATVTVMDPESQVSQYTGVTSTVDILVPDVGTYTLVMDDGTTTAQQTVTVVPVASVVTKRVPYRPRYTVYYRSDDPTQQQSRCFFREKYPGLRYQTETL